MIDVLHDGTYVAWLQRKVDAVRKDIDTGRVHTQKEVRAEMDRLIADLERKDREAAEWS